MKILMCDQQQVIWMMQLQYFLENQFRASLVNDMRVDVFLSFTCNKNIILYYTCMSIVIPYSPSTEDII